MVYPKVFLTFTFNLFVSFKLKCISCRQHTVESYFLLLFCCLFLKIHFINLCLLSGVVNPFTLDVITGKVGFMSACFAICFLRFLYLLKILPFLLSFVLNRYFLLFHLKFVISFTVFLSALFLVVTLGIIINILINNNLRGFLGMHTVLYLCGLLDSWDYVGAFQSLQWTFHFPAFPFVFYFLSMYCLLQMFSPPQTAAMLNNCC